MLTWTGEGFDTFEVVVAVPLDDDLDAVDDTRGVEDELAELLGASTQI